MNQKLLLPTIYLYNGMPVEGYHAHDRFGDGQTAVELASYYSNCGADGILVLDLESDTDEAHEKNIDCMKEIIRISDVPVYAGGVFKRFEDAKKYLYTGAKQAVIFMTEQTSVKELEESLARFGKEKLMICVDRAEVLMGQMKTVAEKLSDQALVLDDADKLYGKTSHQLIVSLDTDDREQLKHSLAKAELFGITGQWIQNPESDLMELKNICDGEGIPMNIARSKLKWTDFKLNSDGMVPVIVQDYKTNEVLMMAYMNEEAFQETILSGKMTYWSRSRNELWKKGLTSGHFQFVKELKADCDYDTILAKVSQVGAACHTGERSCFFRDILKKDYQDTNPLKVFEDVFAVIMDRKEHPKEGSYTNYLFDKGIDKILKKVGEEATEIVIAAKNPNPEEIKYEISDFLYHVMVLMAERGVTWEDITRELSQR